MSTIMLDKENVKSWILSGLSSTIYDVNRACSVINYTSVPNDLPYRYNYSSFVSDMNEIYKDLNNINAWFENSIKRINDSNNRVYESAKLLPKSRVPIRVSTLK